MLEKLFIAGMIILVGAYFVALFIDAKDYQERKEIAQQFIEEFGEEIKEVFC